VQLFVDFQTIKELVTVVIHQQKPPIVIRKFLWKSLEKALSSAFRIKKELRGGATTQSENKNFIVGKKSLE